MPQRFLHISPNDVTLDAQAVALAAENEAAGPKVQLVEGSSLGLIGDTECVLRVRLRAAALVLLIGSAAFLIRNVFGGDLQGTKTVHLELSGRLLFWFHFGHVVVLAIVNAVLWRRGHQFSMRQLRWAEFVVFAWTAAFFLRVQHYQMVFSATNFDTLWSPAAIWLSLMFTYAIFIPNTWRRAAVSLGLLAIAPIAWMSFDIAYELAIQKAWEKDPEPYSTTAIMLLVGFGAGVTGTHMIGRLRREVYEARQLGQYRLKHLIGAGGMGEVYLAEHRLLKRPCAIKIIRAGKADDPTVLARFEREVRATAALSHWNTVEIFDYGHADDGTFFYVMEYLPGLSLAELVERYGPLPPERVIHLLRQVCDALREAHAAGLIHRDIKPGNIFAAQRGGVYDVAKLLDFGLVKPLGIHESLQLTQDGAITGSPLYMSPEQVVGEGDSDPRGDIYSTGAVAYFLLTGRPPFEGDKPIKILMAHVHDEIVPPSRLRPDIPADLERVVLRCLAKRPEDRFQDVVSLEQALAGCERAGEWTRQRAAGWWYETEHASAVAAS
ncbi:MAG TPA: serine/threonine-protein kinase [Pirellulales bacterium]|nr:serine/threonine-protein kinase [Pirellulales bacterium]